MFIFLDHHDGIDAVSCCCATVSESKQYGAMITSRETRSEGVLFDEIVSKVQELLDAPSKKNRNQLT